MMWDGVKKFLNKPETEAPVRSGTLWVCAYLLGIPMALLAKLADSEYVGWALTLLAVTARWHLFR